jgi:predicted nucleic acid-binding protein
MTRMPARTFLDTNVLVYAADEGEPRKRDIARAIFGVDEPGQLVVSTQVLSEFYLVVTRKLRRPMSEADASDAVDELAKLPTVITDTELVRSGIALSREQGLSFWDGLIVAAAASAGCIRVLTEDLSHGTTIAGVRVENPFISLT